MSDLKYEARTLPFRRGSMEVSRDDGARCSLKKDVNRSRHHCVRRSHKLCFPISKGLCRRQHEVSKKQCTNALIGSLHTTTAAVSYRSRRAVRNNTLTH